MPKAVVTSQPTSSPGSSGAVSIDVRLEKGPAPREGAGVGERTSPGRVSSQRTANLPIRKNGRLKSDRSLECWPATLDGHLKQLLADGGEREAISIFRNSHPELSEQVIWGRIVCLGLTNRKRPPYEKHLWTEAEDDILRADYGRSRKSSHQVIKRMLELHPGWSRDAVVRRAQVLGLTQSRNAPTQRWSADLDHWLLSLMGCQIETIAERLKRSKKSILARLRRLGHGAEFFGGFKTKDVIRDLRVAESVVSHWVWLGWLKRKRGRITEESLCWLCRNHPEAIPFETLDWETQNWLMLSMGFGRGPAVRHGGRRRKTPGFQSSSAEFPERASEVTS